MIDENGILKLLDYGFACSTSKLGKRPKEACGSLLYMAPELFPQIAADTITSIHKEPTAPNLASADMWACGVVFFALLMGGHLPFQARTERDIVQRIRKGIFKIDDGVSDLSRDLISKMLSNDIATRAKPDEIISKLTEAGIKVTRS